MIAGWIYQWAIVLMGSVIGFLGVELFYAKRELKLCKELLQSSEEFNAAHKSTRRGGRTVMNLIDNTIKTIEELIDREDGDFH